MKITEKREREGGRVLSKGQRELCEEEKSMEMLECDKTITNGMWGRRRKRDGRRRAGK